MQRDPAQSSRLRRRYQAFQEQKQRNEFCSSTSDTSLDGLRGLELSMHLPTEPYRNRFNLLTPPSPPPTFNFSSGDRAHLYPRRYRHSRGTREAKRRRGARRNQRKLFAAQNLDVQLSSDIDKTLTSANIYRPPQLRLAAPKPRNPIYAVDQPHPARMPPTPSQLPFLNFGGLDLMQTFPELSTLQPDPTPSQLPMFTPQIPRWCPDVPSIVNKRSSGDDLPLFFDLSSLPEPFQPPPPTPRCQEVQLHQPKAISRPIKQSRFFPPRPSSPLPKVNLPSTSCVLHSSDRGVHIDLPPRPPGTQQKAINTPEPQYDEATKASAANLWRILTSKDGGDGTAGNDPYVDSFASEHILRRLSAPFELFDTRMEAIGMPTELDSTEVPYVHANALTGQGNERAEHPQREVEEHRTVICDSPLSMTFNSEELNVGLNELVVDHDVSEADEQRYWDA